MAKVYGANCKGSIFSTADLIVTCENNLEDDDHYLGPYLDPPTSTTRNRNRHLTSSVPSAHTPTSSERTANNAETNENSVSAKKGRISPLVADSISTRSFCMVQEEETSNEPSKGILAAIIIGCIVGAALVVAFLYYKIFMEGKLL